MILDKRMLEGHTRLGGGRFDEKRVSRVDVFELLEGNSRKTGIVSRCDDVWSVPVRWWSPLRGFASRPNDFVVLSTACRATAT